MTDEAHIPVLYNEVLAYLQPQANGRYIDGTLGAGGHTQGILDASAPSGHVLAFDRDPNAAHFAQERLAAYGQRLTVVHASYSQMGDIAPAHGFTQPDGILLDLGLSSRQLAAGERGFSFMKEGPLDMRFDTTQGQTAAHLVNNLSESELANIFWRYGEEKKSRKLAQLIVQHRPITTTSQLATLVANHAGKRGAIHPATRLFQALRIAVNDELTIVEKGVQTAVSLLKSGGRLVVISFHSLEDRIVKQLFRQLSQTYQDAPELPTGRRPLQPTVRLITKKPVQPSAAELSDNPRSRSARLRVAEKI